MVLFLGLALEAWEVGGSAIRGARAKWQKVKKMFADACSNCGMLPRNGRDYYCKACRSAYNSAKGKKVADWKKFNDGE